MNEFKLGFHGKRADLNDLLADFGTADGVSSVSVQKESPGKAASVLSRDPLNQFELVDVVVAFAVNLAAAYTYEEIRSAIRKRAKAKGFSETPPEEVETK